MTLAPSVGRCGAALDCQNGPGLALAAAQADHSNAVSGSAPFAKTKLICVTHMWPRFWKPFVIVIPSAAIVLAVLYMTYRFIDPIPPRPFMIAAGMAASGHVAAARHYARRLARGHRYVHLFSRSEQPQTRWTRLPGAWIWTPPKQSMD